MTDHDPVTRPAHYRWLPSDLEVIDITEGLGFCMGNVVKYVLRADHKGNPIEDLKKARWYLDREIARREGTSAPVSAVRDRDGDLWKPDDEGMWRPMGQDLSYMGGRTLERLTRDYGPLQEVVL